MDVARELIKPHRIIHYLWHTAWPDGQNRYQATEQAVRAAGMQLQSRGIAEISELDAAVAGRKMVAARLRSLCSRARSHTDTADP